MEKILMKDLPALFGKLKGAMVQNRDYLIELDGKVGDSDLGLTMSKAFTVASDYVANNQNDSIGQTFMRAGMEISKSAPSTMGTLMATGFMRGGKALGETDSISAPQMLDFWRAFLTGVMERGKAKPGDKTLVDVLAPVVKSLEISVEKKETLSPAMTSALAAAEKGLQETKNMMAHHGKAACFGEKNLGLQDAGATVAKILIETFSAFVNLEKS